MTTSSGRLKTDYYALTAFGSLATSYYFNYLFFFLRDRFGFENRGNLTVAAIHGGIYVFAPDGTHLGTIETGVATANCAWGDDGSVLYIAADKAIWRIKLATKGAGF